MKTGSKIQTVSFCLLTLVIVFIFYVHTLGYDWRFFDERIIYGETILPVPKTFSEIFEFISTFGINNHFEASNTFYTEISNIRGTPADVIFNLFFYRVFQKSAFNYHLFSLSVHIGITCILFILLNRISLLFNINNVIRLLTISILTLFFSLHPVNVESVLFATNYGALITYFLCLVILFELSSLYKTNTIKLSLRKWFFLFVLYLFSLFLNEYAITLPFIIFCYLFALSVHKNKMNYKNAFFYSIKIISPLLAAFALFIIYFFSIRSVAHTQENSLILSLQRILWLSPQIFLHNLKLMLYPAKLSIDQSSLVKISDRISDPYALTACILSFSFILFSLISFLNLKRKRGCLFFTMIVPFMLALSPFLHIFTPIYNLSSERYLYFPIILFILGISTSVFYCLSKIKNRKAGSAYFIIFLLLCTMPYGMRAYTRTFDWKNSFTLLSSAVNTAPNNLFKGLRQQMISTSYKVFKDQTTLENTNKYNALAMKSLYKAINEFNNKKSKQKNMPLILKFYGLDPKTLAAKSAFLLSFCKYETSGNEKIALEIFKPYADDLNSFDTNILNFYYRILFMTKNFDEAERILQKNLIANRISPTLFLALSDIYEVKYNDLNNSLKYLSLSFKTFPYNSLTLYGLKRFHQKTNDAPGFAHFSYLYGLRNHDPQSLEQAVLVYIGLKNKKIASEILKKLTSEYAFNDEKLTMLKQYKEYLGKL